MPKSILVVEDEVAIADNIAYALRTEGFVPHHVSLGQQALDMLRSGSEDRPELIVLDIGVLLDAFLLSRRDRHYILNR